MQQPLRQNTKAALMSAAERLIAEKGLGGVSVREITKAAGARNESALQYHFGSMEDLIREVFARRYREIDQSRLEILEKMDADDVNDDLDRLLEAAIRPLLLSCQDVEGRLYARFSAQLTADPRFDMVDLVRSIGLDSVRALGERIGNCIADLPESIRETRLRRLLPFSALIMADYARQIEAGKALPVELAISEAKSSMAGFLRAPV